MLATKDSAIAVMMKRYTYRDFIFDRSLSQAGHEETLSKRG
jgi:hypothetical protein